MAGITMSPQFLESPETPKDQVSKDCADDDSWYVNRAQSNMPVANLEFRCFKLEFLSSNPGDCARQGV
jgi:hypothetical protein